MLQFTGTVGNWTRKLVCEHQKWVTDVDVLNYIKQYNGNPIKQYKGKDRLGIMQIRLVCNNQLGNDGNDEGQIFPYGNPEVHGVRVSPSRGPLVTEDPQSWSAGSFPKKLELRRLWKKAITCRNFVQHSTQFVQGVKVQTDQDTDLISLEGLEIVPDMVGINDVQLSCAPYNAAYSELNFTLELNN